MVENITEAAPVAPKRPLRRSTVTRIAPLLLAALAGCAGGSTDGTDEDAAARAMPAAGRWQGSLNSPGGALTFGLDLVDEPDGLRVVILNGEERRPAGLIEPTDEGLAFRIPPYQSRIVATLVGEGTALVGYWERDRGKGPQPVLPFAAVEGRSPTDATFELTPGQVESISGRWSVQFDGDEDPSVGVFEVQPSGHARGTFLTTLGDYRFLAGRFDGTTLLLSCFDGAHAFLFDASLGQDGNLTGNFWSRDSYHTTWVGAKDPNASLPDDFALTSWVSGTSLSELRFPDLEGNERALDDPAFQADARLMVVFGSWCPNCNDLTEYLVELRARYAGLSVLGIAFELGDDPAAMRRTVKEYMAHHGANYPVLIGGTYDKAKASAALPILDRVRSYPTTVFMDREGNVSAVHTGFSGPATGDRHEALKTRFESEIESLLAGD